MRYIFIILLILTVSCSDNSTSWQNSPHIQILYIIPFPDERTNFQEVVCIHNPSEQLFKGIYESYYIKNRRIAIWHLDLGVMMQYQRDNIKFGFGNEFNNDGDTLDLYNTNQERIQTVIYGKINKGDTVWAK